jgi:hypothetical protein
MILYFGAYYIRQHIVCNQVTPCNCANVKPSSLDMNRVALPEITVILQMNARPLSRFSK